MIVLPTTGGSLVFDGYQPKKDAWLVAKLRDAGALILGKANLSEFANSGYASQSAFGEVWNAFDPSKSSIGSSGGSAVAVASSFAAASLGTQTGDSLWGPAGAASLFSLRGSDGMGSTDGVMPLTYIQDYAGFFTKSIADLALLMQTTAVDDPEDPLDDVANGHRPTDWTKYLSADALQGKVIGVPATAFNDLFQTTNTSNAMRAQFKYFTQAGATVKDIADPPPAPTTTTGDKNYEGWLKWIQAHPDNPYTDPVQIIRSAKRLPQYRNTTTYTGTGAMTNAEIKAFQDYRANYRAILGQWMDDQGVDAVVFPTELSDIHLNDGIEPTFGRRDPQASASGVPTVIMPVGTNDNGQPIGLQLEGRAWSDDQLLGYANAFELLAHGQVDPTDVTPALAYDADATPTPIVTMTPAPNPAPTGQLTITRTHLKAGKKGTFKVQVGCASEKLVCTGTVSVSYKGRSFSSSKVSVSAGHIQAVTVKISKAARKQLKKHGKADFQVYLAGTGSTVTTAEPVKVTVRRSRS